MRGAEGQAQLQQRFRGLNPQPERSEPRRSALLASAAGTAATPERDKRSWPRGRGCAVSRKPKTPPKSVLNHEGAPWPRSLLGMGTLVSAVRQRSAPGATANRRSFAETTANCSQLGPRREYSPAHGTSPNAFRRMARNGGTHPAEAGRRRTWSRLLRALTAAPQGMEQGSGGPEGSQHRPGASPGLPSAPAQPSPCLWQPPKLQLQVRPEPPGSTSPTQPRDPITGPRAPGAARPLAAAPRPGLAPPGCQKTKTRACPGWGGPARSPAELLPQEPGWMLCARPQPQEFLPKLETKPHRFCRAQKGRGTAW